MPLVKLFVLRHADADTPAPSDDRRALSAKGIDQTNRMAAFCKHHAQIPEVILHSPLVRTRETAELFGEGVGLARLIEVPWLACGMTPATALKELMSYQEFFSVMLVGHEPDLGQLIAACLGMEDAGALHIRKASLTCLQLGDFKAGAGRLEYHLPAKLIKP